MFGSRVITKNVQSFNFPKTKLKNVTCVHCKHQFIVRELLHMRGSQVPLLLECGHSICYGCAKLYPNKPCSLCKLLVQVDEKSSELYPLHIYALGLAVIANNRPIHGEDPDISFHQTMSSKLRQIRLQGICYECEVDATLRCPQCNALYCHACYSKIHGKALQKHTKVSLTETVKDVPLAVGTTCSDICKEFLGYFCRDCQISSCSHCMLRFHSKHNHITLQERNEELMDNFYKVYDSVAENLQRVQQTQKKLKTIQISPMEIQLQESVETSITQHFAHLHGVLQNVEKKMIDKLYERRTCFNKNLANLEAQLTSHQDRLQDMLLMAANAKDNIEKINIEEVICKLEEIADVPCHLVHETLANEDKILFEADVSIINTLEKHCTLHVPSKSEVNLLNTKLLPKNYPMEPLTREMAVLPSSSNYPSNEVLPSLKKSISTISISSAKLDNSFVTDSSELVKVMNVVDPSCFFVQSWSNQKQAEELSNNLQIYGANASPLSKEISAGKMYIVEYSREKIWRRGRVTKVNSFPDNSNSSYDVFYVDSGYLERNVTINRFRPILPQHATLPMLAMRCCLYDVVPNGARWSKVAIDEFRKLTEIHVPVSMHIFNTNGNVHYVDLCFNPNDSRGDVISMRDTLVLMEHGTFVSMQRLMRMNPLSMQKYFPEELEPEIWVDVYVTLVESLDCIYVTKVGENKNYIDNLTSDMTMFYKKNASSPTLSFLPEIGIPCALLHTNELWYRGLIKNIVNKDTVEVFCVDFGYSLILCHDMLRRLPINYMSGRTQAIKVSLRDVKPLPEDKGEWNIRTTEFVCKFLTDQKVKVISMGKVDDTHSVHVYIHGKNSFNTLLVSSDLAVASGALTSVIIPTDKKRNSKKKRNAKNQKALMYNMDEDNMAKASNSKIGEADPFKVCVQVHQARSPDCIYVSDVTREKANMDLMTKIQQFYTKYHSPEKINLTKDAVCAVYSNKDKSYFRARILKIVSEEEVLVFFYDMAIEEVISVNNIQPLHPKFEQEPAYLFKVKLAGILPCGSSGTWPSSSCQKLTDIINENQNGQFYITKVAEMEDSTEIPVQLLIKQLRPEGPLSPTKIEISSVSKLLVDAGLALPVKGYNEKTEKILAVEFKRQLQEMQITSLSNEDGKEDIQWFSMSKTTSESSNTSSHEEQYSSATSISNATLSQNLTDWLPALPIKNTNFIAVPTYLDHDGALYLHPKKEGNAILEGIESALSDFYKKVEIRACDREWKVGDICIAQYHLTKKWYRARVIQILDKNTIKVHFVDYGNEEECEIGSVKKRIILGDTPIQCTKCIILGLNPDNEKGTWQTEDLDKVHALLVEKDCKVSIVERKDTHLIISIKLIKPKKCDLISYLTNELGIRLSPNPLNSSDSKILDDTNFENISTDSPDVIIEKYTTKEETSPEIYTDSEMIMDNIVDTDHVISGSSMMIREAEDELNHESYSESYSWDNTETIKKEAVYSTPEDMSVENFVTYTPLVIPDDIDMFEVELCCTAIATEHYVQIAENKQLKVFNDYYNQYHLVLDDMQKDAAKQPLIQDFTPNTPCCAMFSDNTWYRCVIRKLDKIKNKNEFRVQLYYVDYGNDEKRRIRLDESGLHTLKEEWLSVPIMAIKCHLWHVSTPDGFNVPELKAELSKIYSLYRYNIVKIKERYEDHLDVELYVDRRCKQLIYSSLIKNGFLQIKKAKED